MTPQYALQRQRDAFIYWKSVLSVKHRMLLTDSRAIVNICAGDKKTDPSDSG